MVRMAAVVSPHRGHGGPRGRVRADLADVHDAEPGMKTPPMTTGGNTVRRQSPPARRVARVMWS